MLNVVNMPDRAWHMAGPPSVLDSSLATLPRWTSSKPIRVLRDEVIVTGSGTGMWLKPSWLGPFRADPRALTEMVGRGICIFPLA